MNVLEIINIWSTTRKSGPFVCLVLFHLCIFSFPLFSKANNFKNDSIIYNYATCNNTKSSEMLYEMAFPNKSRFGMYSNAFEENLTLESHFSKPSVPSMLSISANKLHSNGIESLSDLKISEERPLEYDTLLYNLCDKLKFKSGCNLETKFLHFDGFNTLVSSVELKNSVQMLSKSHNSKRKSKRDANVPPPSKNQRMCKIRVIVDHKFYEHCKKIGISVSHEVRRILTPIAENFKYLDFVGNNKPDGFQLEMRDLKIFSSVNTPGNPVKDGSLQPLEFLKHLSKYGKERSCLTITFTSRDFYEHRTLGMAYVASSNPKGPDGGICAPYQYYPGHGQHRLNNLFVTNRFNNENLPIAAVQLVLFHLIGHSFGAQHDSPDDPGCSGINKASKIAMAGVSSPLPNIMYYTECNLMRMNAVIRNKGHCLGEWYNKLDLVESLCGNGIIDSGEECDCGSEETCSHLDKCCIAYDCKIDRISGYQCSPMVSSCCTDMCQIAKPSDGMLCDQWSECKDAIYCRGQTDCPNNDLAKRNGYSCSGDSRTCHNGSCTSTICQDNKLMDCECLKPKSDQCRICCLKDGQCRSYFDLNLKVPNDPNKILNKPIGSSCLNGYGVCEGHGICKPISEKPLNDEVTGFPRRGDKREFWKNYWFYVLLAILSIYLIYAYIRELLRHRQIMKRVIHFEEAVEKAKGNFVTAPPTHERMLNTCSRLSVLFPFTPMSMIVEVSNKMESEEKYEKDAVMELLQRGELIRTNYSTVEPPKLLRFKMHE